MAYNPYSNTYNPGWANHPNFSWGGQKKNARAAKLNPPLKFAFLESMESLFKAFFATIDSTCSKIAEALVFIAGSHKNMENQPAEIHKVVYERLIGSLPSQPEIAATKERKKKKVNAIGLRSGKAIDRC